MKLFRLFLIILILPASSCADSIKSRPPGFIQEKVHSEPADWSRKPSAKNARAVKEVFLKFTKLMNEGHYEDALRLYGWRDYDKLVAYNPDLPPADYVGLIKRADLPPMIHTA